MPHKRRHRLKDYKNLVQMAESDPENKDIFEQNLIENYYPERPNKLDDICLYDFVDYYGYDNDGNRKLKKPRLPNH